MDEYTPIRAGLLIVGIGLAIGGFMEYRKKSLAVATPLFIVGVLLAILSGTIL